jgi:hypothetical protein
MEFTGIIPENCLAQDEAKYFLQRTSKMSAGFFIDFFIGYYVIKSWIMSVDPHGLITLFGWYVFASFFVSGITTICLISLYLKSRDIWSM